VESANRERGGVLIAGRYRLHEQVDGGGRSQVWRATDELQGRIVAVKRVALFGLPAAEAASVRDRVLRESGAAASRYHPNVVAIFDVVVEGGELWVIQEYLPARTLADIVGERGPLPARDVAAIGAQVASALAAAHAAGVVHRNINPDNILVAWPVVKVDDFGITPPEATPVVDRRNDIHALGGALYTAVGGHGDASQAGPLMWPLACLMAADPAARPTAVQAEVMLREVFAGVAGPAPAGTGRRGIALGLVIGLVAAIVMTGAVVLASRLVDSGPSPATAAGPTSAPPALTIGDPRNADPCALVDEPALRRHGTTDVEPSAGAMTSCWAYVAVRPETMVDLSLELMPASFQPEEPGGLREERGPLTLIRYAFDGSYCTRRINLPDSTAVLVVASTLFGVDAETACAVADTGATGAVDRLLAAGVTERATRIDGTVLGGQDACRLMTIGDLQAVPGIVPTPVPGLANWSCRWGEWTGPSVTVTFWRRSDELLKDETSIDIGGRPSTLYRSPTDDGGCNVTVPQQRFESHLESVSVYVYDPRVGADACGAVTAIATAIAAKLPAPS
jgi:tRNA A-37 threonylcarbamoyl transferase component Bud32